MLVVPVLNHEIQELLQEVSYRPGWTVTAHRHPFGSYILIDAEVLDSERWDKNLPVDVNYKLGNTTRVGVRACVPPGHTTAKEFYDWLEWRLGKVEIHEMREFFMVGGKPWNSPHKRKQPKHDYHVRLTRLKCTHPWIEDMGDKWTFCEDAECTGYVLSWVVYRHHDYGLHDMLGPVIATAQTMQEAYIKAIQQVVEDDLAKGLVGPNG